MARRKTTMADIVAANKAKAAAKKLQRPDKKLTKKEGEALLKALTKEMQMASRALEFERAAQLRDMIFELQDTMGINSRHFTS